MEVNNQLHTQATSPLEKESLVPTDKVEDWLGPTADQGNVEKRLLPLPRIKSRFFGCPGCGFVTVLAEIIKLYK
jgi:hypothetical protein